MEKHIVDTLVADLSWFDRNEPEKSVENQVRLVLPLLLQPDLAWHTLFDYLYQVVDQLGGLSDPTLCWIITTLRDAEFIDGLKLIEFLRLFGIQLPNDVENAQHVDTD